MMQLWKWYLVFVFSSCTILTVVESQPVSVDPQVTAYLGGKVTLRCLFSQGDTDAKAVQVEWVKQPGSDALAVFHPEHGKSYPSSPLHGRVTFTSNSVNDASISITNVNDTDEGTYTCIYATHPEGNIEGTTTLTVRDPAERPWKGTAAVVSGIASALLLIGLIAAAVYFILMKSRRRYDAPTCRNSSEGDQAARVTGGEDQEVHYADVAQFRPAQGKAVTLQSREGTEHAGGKHSDHAGGGGVREEEGGDVTYAQVRRS